MSTPEEIEEQQIGEAIKTAAQSAGWDGAKFPPGKFEAEPYYTPYYWEVSVMDGAGEVVGDSNVLEIIDVERKLLELPADASHAVVNQTTDGFVQCHLVTREEYNEMCAATEVDIEHDGQPDEAKEWEDFDPDC